MITEEEKAKILEYEDVISEVNKRRNPKSEKKWWEAAGMITSITALSTLTLTALFGYCTQSRLRDNDFTTQQSKAAYESEVVTLQSAHLLATESLHWAGERARLLFGDYKNFPAEDKNPLIDSVNASDFKWRQGRQSEKIGVQLSFGGSPEVVQAWDSVVARLDRYANCTRALPPRDCEAQKSPAAGAIDSFRKLSVNYIRTRWRGIGMY